MPFQLYCANQLEYDKYFFQKWVVYKSMVVWITAVLPLPVTRPRPPVVFLPGQPHRGTWGEFRTNNLWWLQVCHHQRPWEHRYMHMVLPYKVFNGVWLKVTYWRLIYTSLHGDCFMQEVSNKTAFHCSNSCVWIRSVFKQWKYVISTLHISSHCMCPCLNSWGSHDYSRESCDCHVISFLQVYLTSLGQTYSEHTCTATSWTWDCTIRYIYRAGHSSLLEIKLPGGFCDPTPKQVHVGRCPWGGCPF